MSFVAVDLGASSTRNVCDTGTINVIENYMNNLPIDKPCNLMPDYGDLASSLEIYIEKTSGEPCEHFPAHILMGMMADRYSSVHERPSINSKKVLQRINFLNTIAVTAINKLNNNLDDNLSLYIAVPPLEVELAREQFKKLLTGSYKVTFPKYQGGTVVEFNITDVYCFEESLMSITSFFFNMNGTKVEENIKYLNGTVLSMNIGASTTDLAIVKNGRYLDKSGKTYRVGGNEVRDFLIDRVLAEYDIDLSIEDAEIAIAEGRLQQGNSFMDIKEIIEEGKGLLARKLLTHLNTYFKAIGIDIHTIRAIVVSGGGSLHSQYINENGEVVVTTKPMSDFVMQELLNLSPDTLVVPYGNEARLADLKGLFIRAKLTESQKNSVNNQVNMNTMDGQTANA